MFLHFWLQKLVEQKDNLEKMSAFSLIQNSRDCEQVAGRHKTTLQQAQFLTLKALDIPTWDIQKGRLPWPVWLLVERHPGH